MCLAINIIFKYLDSNELSENEEKLLKKIVDEINEKLDENPYICE
jgi:hypothetical protein